MKKEYITPQTLVIRTETMAPIATSDDFTVNIENGGSDYDGEFYSKPKTCGETTKSSTTSPTACGQTTKSSICRVADTKKHNEYNFMLE